MAGGKIRLFHPDGDGGAAAKSGGEIINFGILRRLPVAESGFFIPAARRHRHAAAKSGGEIKNFGVYRRRAAAKSANIQKRAAAGGEIGF